MFTSNERKIPSLAFLPPRLFCLSVTNTQAHTIHRCYWLSNISLSCLFTQLNAYFLYTRMHIYTDVALEPRSKESAVVCLRVERVAQGRWGGLNVNCLITPISHSCLQSRTHTQTQCTHTENTLLPAVSYVATD